MSHQNRSVVRFVALSAAIALAAGCLDRPITPAKPHTTNLFVEAVAQNFIDKIDLLFMIDNSLSMKDKQVILEQAVPVLVQRLVTPRCLDATGNAVGTADVNGVCATGDPEFIAIKDIHIGVITSSLGTHGGIECDPRDDGAATGRTQDDRAELLPLVRSWANLTSWQGSGFLAWDPGQKYQPPGEGNLQTLTDAFRAQVAASGEIGCGFESSLEAWYRFLVDPEPPTSINVVNNLNAKGPVNTALLTQRAAFLRPDSLLAVVMLTDENDCSINDDDGTQGFFVTSTGSRMPRASSKCATDPNDRCCETCAVAAPEGCPPHEQDPECAKGAYLAEPDDRSNIRCFDHKRRFGRDFLYPVGRYVDALTKRTVKNRAGTDVPNPIFAGPGSGRSQNLVVLAGIVGVPWQDIATEASLTGPGLEYLDAGELAKNGRWDLILGDRTKNHPPDDPHMRESVEPRAGAHPLLGTPLAPATSQNPEEDPINGHEQAVPIVMNAPYLNDLQYACTFELPVPRDCSTAANNACDCDADDYANNRPLCDYPNGPNTDGIQRYAKAYPGLRHLEVLKGLGDNGIVASICPKNTAPAAGVEPQNDPSYGYNPAVASILEVLGKRLQGQCLPRKLTVDDEGQVDCRMVEATLDDGSGCTCDATKGRHPVDSVGLRRAVRDELSALKYCGADSSISCGSYCQCEIEQLEGAELATCQAGATAQDLYGYCYIDEQQNIGNPALVASCPATQRRLLHWTGEGLPAKGSVMMMACFGASL